MKKSPTSIWRDTACAFIVFDTAQRRHGVCVIGCVSCVSCLVYHVCMCVSVHSVCVSKSLVCCVCMYPYWYRSLHPIRTRSCCNWRVSDGAAILNKNQNLGTGVVRGELAIRLTQSIAYDTHTQYATRHIYNAWKYIYVYMYTYTHINDKIYSADIMCIFTYLHIQIYTLIYIYVYTYINHNVYSADMPHMSHVTYEWVMQHKNEACHTWMSRVTYESVMSHMN